MNANEPAYPVEVGLCHTGLTKRELIAAMCLQGLLANNNSDGTFKDYICDAIELTDALLAKLAKEPQ